MTSTVASKPAAKRAAASTTKRKNGAAATATAPTPKAQPKADAKTEAKAPARYADADTAQAVADRLAAARAKGFTRPAVMELTGYTASAIWRAENGRVHPGEVATVTAALDRVESGDVAPPERRNGGRARVADLEARLDATCRDLKDAVETEKSLASLRKRVAATLAALTS